VNSARANRRIRKIIFQVTVPTVLKRAFLTQPLN